MNHSNLAEISILGSVAAIFATALVALPTYDSSTASTDSPKGQFIEGWPSDGVPLAAAPSSAITLGPGSVGMVREAGANQSVDAAMDAISNPGGSGSNARGARARADKAVIDQGLASAQSAVKEILVRAGRTVGQGANASLQKMEALKAASDDLRAALKRASFSARGSLKEEFDGALEAHKDLNSQLSGAETDLRGAVACFKAQAPDDADCSAKVAEAQNKLANIVHVTDAFRMTVSRSLALAQSSPIVGPGTAKLLASIEHRLGVLTRRSLAAQPAQNMDGSIQKLAESLQGLGAFSPQLLGVEESLPSPARGRLQAAREELDEAAGVAGQVAAAFEREPSVPENALRDLLSSVSLGHSALRSLKGAAMAYRAYKPRVRREAAGLAGDPSATERPLQLVASVRELKSAQAGEEDVYRKAWAQERSRPHREAVGGRKKEAAERQSESERLKAEFSALYSAVASQWKAVGERMNAALKDSRTRSAVLYRQAAAIQEIAPQEAKRLRKEAARLMARSWTEELSIHIYYPFIVWEKAVEACVRGNNEARGLSAAECLQERPGPMFPAFE